MSQAIGSFPEKVSHRRRRKLPIWQVYWRQLTIAQQERVKSIAWAISFHLFVVAVLAAVSLTTPSLVTIDLNCSFNTDATVETITMLAESDTRDQFEEEPDVLEASLPEIPQPFAELESLEISLDTQQSQAKVGSEATSVLSSLAQASSITEMQNDEQRVAETNRRVAAAGGKLEGPIRVSLIFNGDDDIDLHVQYQSIGRQPAMQRAWFPYHVFFQNPRTEHAMLDVDANANYVVPDPCENIIFRTVPKSGNYIVAIHHYQPRGRIEPTPYVVVVNYGANTKVFRGTILPRDGMMKIWEFRFSK